MELKVGDLVFAKDNDLDPSKQPVEVIGVIISINAEQDIYRIEWNDGFACEEPYTYARVVEWRKDLLKKIGQYEYS